MEAISGLGAISAVVMTIYGIVRFADIVVSGKAPLLLGASWDVANFWTEILLMVVIPVALLSRRRFRVGPATMFWVGVVATVGLSLNRVNVSGLATLSLTRANYMPAWTEWAVSAGILAAAGLAYLFCVEYFGIFSNITTEDVDRARTPGALDLADWKTTFFGAHNHGEARVYSLAFIGAAAVSFGCLSTDAVFGVTPVATATSGPRRIQVVKGGDGSRTPFVVAPRYSEAGGPAGETMALMIDGNRNGRYVLFDHEAHLNRPNGKQQSCAQCHHMNKPLDSATSCFECHQDQYLPVDLFDHRYHEHTSGGNAGCVECHASAAAPRVRASTPECKSCHPNMRPTNTRVLASDESTRDRPPGYMQAMHGLCITCHEEQAASLEVVREGFAECSNCHGNVPGLTDAIWEGWR